MAAHLIPTPEKRSFWERAAPATAFATISSGLGGWVTLIGIGLTSTDPSPALLWFAAMSAVLGTVGTVLAVGSAFKKEAREAQYDHPADFTAALQVLYLHVMWAKGYHPDDGAKHTDVFRVTLHTRRDDHYYQCCDYVGCAPDPKRRPGGGRKWPTTKGLPGQAFRREKDRDTITVKKLLAKTNDERVTALINEYGYTADEARALRPDRYAVAAIPILGPDGDVIAVLYADSSETDFFDDVVVVQLMMISAQAVVRYAEYRANIVRQQ